MRFQRTVGVGGGSAGGGEGRPVVERRERRNEVSCQVRPQPQVRRVCRTLEEMLSGVGQVVGVEGSRRFWKVFSALQSPDRN